MGSRSLRNRRILVYTAAAVCMVLAAAFILRGEIRAWVYRGYTEVPVVTASDWFDYPVGAPNAHGYYRAQRFGENRHLGGDWNGMGGGNSDLGDPVYSIANGSVSFAEEVGRGWGNVIRIVHPVRDGESVEAVYAHLHEIRVRAGERIRQGQIIGTMGGAHRIYPAHLHFEIRTKPGLPLGGGYGPNTDDFCDPSSFINDHRKVGRNR